MITKEITICRTVVNLAYCYATEIAYKDLAGEDMYDYVLHAVECIHQQRDPDVKRTIYAILAAMMAYYSANGTDAPLKDADLMRNANPAEIGIAIFTIINLRQQFYKSSAEADENEKEDAEKKD